MRREKSAGGYVPPGCWPAEVKYIKDDTSQFGPVVRVGFEIMGTSKHAGVEVEGLFSATYSENSKFGKIVKAALEATTAPESFDDKEMIGGKVALVTKDHVAKGSTYTKIEDILPYGAAKDVPF